MNKEYFSKDYLFKKADIIKGVLDSRGIPNDHQKEYTFIHQHHDGLQRLTRIKIKKQNGKPKRI